MEEDDMVKSMAIASYRDEPMREEGLQTRGAYKGVPRPSRKLALATPKSPRACTRVRVKRSLHEGSTLLKV
jgi:hypothetical protein